VADVRESTLITGVKTVELASFSDERGRFLETFRKEWFPERSWEAIQANRSDSKKGVLRGLHFHRQQVDYWVLAEGRVRVGLYDLRVSSPTRGQAESFELRAEIPQGVFIPVGVAHGFLALEDSTLTYLIDNYYDAGDEFGVAWDDPALGIPWDIRRPVLSPRDRANPRLDEIPLDQLPR